VREQRARTANGLWVWELFYNEVMIWLLGHGSMEGDGEGLGFKMHPK
jgi:hypothetical protein